MCQYHAKGKNVSSKMRREAEHTLKKIAAEAVVAFLHKLESMADRDIGNDRIKQAVITFRKAIEKK